MKMNHSKFSIEKMRKVFKISRSGYYAWRRRKPSKKQLKNQQIKQEIKMIHKASKGRYGSPKITEELRNNGRKVSRHSVAKMMHSQGLRSIICKKYRIATTDSNHHFPVAKNHLDRDFSAQRPAEKWVSDITYIPTLQGWLYLTIIMDLFDRKIIGWALSTTMTTVATSMAAWKMAIKNRPVTLPLIFHSDRGVQYAANEFRNTLVANDQITQSMSRKGNCWDNAVAENFFKILKSEQVNHVKYQSILHAKNDLFEFMEIWYNRKRIHQYLGYKTPEDFGIINCLKSA